MKISLMVLLIATIAALSHLAISENPAGRVATGQPSRGLSSIPLRLAMGGRKIRDRNMWISIFVVVVITAVCLGIAAFMMQPPELI